MNKNVYTVTQVTNYIANMFSQEPFLGNVSVRGELSNVKYHSSGHVYFTLKEGTTQITGAMWKSSAQRLKTRLKDGMEVVVRGKIEVYPAYGSYQLYAASIDAEEESKGKLFEAFERLKEQLEEEGLFAPEYKQPIPHYIKRLGVVTASTGAGIRDIITVSKRRNPAIQILLYPAIVQGEEAPTSIVKGIEALTKAKVDTMIVGRGGGSFEDLNGFNAEMVARAVFDCPIPIISAVGHETDFTIIDFVSDLRAATPSAAAELAVDDVSFLYDTVQQSRRRLDRAMEGVLRNARRQLEVAKMQLERLSPENRLSEKRMRLMQLEERLVRGMQENILHRRHSISIYAERLKGLSPLEKLSKGYGHVEKAEGKSVKHIKDVQKDDALQIFVQDGCIQATVVGTKSMQFE
ncbi:MAG: exodeoxyribonuclease VII large subunit [Lachnospiraceae bacterium]|nr:exodeoxyribonuclease VII large subunit [Lachnospiraceae bacterium]